MTHSDIALYIAGVIAAVNGNPAKSPDPEATKRIEEEIGFPPPNADHNAIRTRAIAKFVEETLAKHLPEE